MNYSVNYQSPVGELLIVSNEKVLIGLWIKEQKYFGAGLKEKPEEVEAEAIPVLQKTVEWLNRYFAGKKPDIAELALAPAGSDFRKMIWRLLCKVPYGEVTTYGELACQAAELMGKPSMSAQAVGGAVGHNPISIIIPCHRVVGSDGSLTGYAGGIDKKIWLLKHEGYK